MDRNQRPLGREEHLTDGDGSVGKHGSALSGGPRGEEKGYGGKNPTMQNRPQFQPQQHKPQGGQQMPAGSAGGRGLAKYLPLIVIALLIYFFFVRGGSGSQGTQTPSPAATGTPTLAPAQTPGQNAQQTAPNNGAQGTAAEEDVRPYGFAYHGDQSGTYGNSGYFTQQTTETNPNSVNTQVANGAREKYTKLLGNGQDTVTLMVFMCGTDLESSYGMATNDLNEMVKANINADKVNIIVYTGGCRRWQNQIISSNNNQLYRVVSGGLQRIADNAGNAPMTDAQTLSSFIQWSAQNYPASRYGLVFWDHGGGTLSGYGSDEKYPRSGSMMINQIAQALKDGGIKFDFVGFDTCLMATLETAMAIEPYADYMIASEETEPGYGWYYTNWLTQLSRNTSVDTLEIGKTICDDFYADNTAKRQGDGITLSVMDLAEAHGTIPDALDRFAEELDALVSGNQYQLVSKARAQAFEFGTSARIDQIDMIDFCERIGTQKSLALADALKGIVKYNKTSRAYANARGVSVYFPYRKLSYLSTVMTTMTNLDFNNRYMSACKKFANLAVGGQVSSGGNSNPLDQLLGGGYGSTSYGGANGDMEAISELFNMFFSGRSIAPDRAVNGLTAANSSWIDPEFIQQNAQYFADNAVDASALKWTRKSNGTDALVLSDAQWEMVEKVELNVFYDDGEGFIDLGLDNLFTFDEDGDLIRKWDGSWLALNGKIVPYYMMFAVSSDDSYAITGRIPVIVNGTVDAYIICAFSNEAPKGKVLGLVPLAFNEKGEPVLGKMTEISNDGLKGATIEFVCDYYRYDGSFESAYRFGEPMTLDGSELTISNVRITEAERCTASYRLTDIYHNAFWTPAINE